MPDIAQNNTPVPNTNDQQGLTQWSQITSDEIRRDLHTLKNEDSTFVGAMEIDGSTDISGNLAVTGDVSFSGAFIGTDISITGDMWVDGTADFSSIGVDGTASLADVSISGWLGVDGSCDISQLNVDNSADFSDIYSSGNFQPTKCITDSGGFLDEDDLASDATASAASQQSIKAYVASQVSVITTDSFTDISTTPQALSTSLLGGRIFDMMLTNADGDKAVFTLLGGLESGVSFKFDTYGAANCAVAEGAEGVFVVTGLGDARTYTVTASTGNATVTIESDAPGVTGTTTLKYIVTDLGA